MHASRATRRNLYHRFNLVRSKILGTLALLIFSGLTHATDQPVIEGFAFTDTINQNIRPFEIDTDYYESGPFNGMLAVCTQGLNGSTQSIDSYVGILGTPGAFTKTTVASGSQYFSSSCFTKGDSLYGTYIDAGTANSLVFYKVDPAGTVTQTSYGSGFRSVDSCSPRAGGTDFLAAVGVNAALHAQVITASNDLSNSGAVFTETLSQGDPFAGSMVTKVGCDGQDGKVYSLGQSTNNDVLLKEYDFGSAGGPPTVVSFTAHVLNPSVNSIGFPNEAGLFESPTGIVACYFDGTNPTVSVIDNNSVMTTTTLAPAGDPNFDIDCRERNNGNVDLLVPGMHFEINPNTRQTIIAHPISITPGDAAYLPIAGSGGPDEAVFGAGSLAYGLGFAAASITQAVAVPTLSDWMLIILALILLGATGWIARRQQIN